MLKFCQYFIFVLTAPLFLYLGGCSGMDMKSPEPEKKPVEEALKEAFKNLFSETFEETV